MTDEDGPGNEGGASDWPRLLLFARLRRRSADQNFSPRAVRTVLMWMWSPLSGANCTYSHSPRRKTLGNSAASRPSPAAPPYAKAPVRASVSVTGPNVGDGKV